MTRKSYDLQKPGQKGVRNAMQINNPCYSSFGFMPESTLQNRASKAPALADIKKMERAETRSISSCDHARAALFYFWKVRMPA